MRSNLFHARWIYVAGLAAVAGVFLFMTRYRAARARLDRVAGELRHANEQWESVSQGLLQARKIQPHFETATDVAARIGNDRNHQPGLGTACRAIVDCADPEITVLKVGGAVSADESGFSSLRIEGIASARPLAERYRHTLQGELERAFRVGVSVRLERLDDLPVTSERRAHPGEIPPASFTLLAKIRLQRTIESDRLSDSK